MHGYAKGAAEMKEMNIPVGVSDFEEIRKNGYAVLLDRMNLSLKNGWQDENGNLLGYESVSQALYL